MKFYTQEEMLDKYIGKKGTEARTEFDAKVRADVESYKIGEAIRQTRKQQQLTQKQLGELVGVQESQISKIESGKSVTFATIAKVFRAMGAKTASLDLGGLGRVALW